MNIVFFVFERITALDAVGPYEVLSRLPGAKTTFAGLARGIIRTDNRVLGISADAAIDEIDSCDLLVVPGGHGTRELAKHEALLTWIRKMDQKTTLTTSVCTGSLLLAAAGLLEGRQATTHWSVLDELARYGAKPARERYVRDGKYATAAGVSAGIDLALALAIELAGLEVAQAIQLGIEYDPKPPIDAGSPTKAPAAVLEAVKKRLA